MNKFLFLLPIILISGCAALESAINNTVSNVTTGILDEFNDTLSNISEQIGEELSKGINDSINHFVSGLLGTNQFSFSSPVSAFSAIDIAYLGINCSGNDSEIAECIKEWQINNMDYDVSKPDSSYSIRWNYAFPGLYPSSEIIREKTENGRVYGICFDYAVIYCSLANYYGLECRVMNSLTKPSDRDASLLPYSTGLGMEEYNDLIVKLRAKGMDYPYELIRQVMKETPEHYWAEVNIDGEWLPFDASNNPTGGNVEEEYIEAGDAEVTVWENNNTMELLRDYTPQVDDLGQTQRSFTIDDFFGSKMSGSAIPVAYYTSCTDVCAFFLGKNPSCAIQCPIDSAFFNCYESCSSENFYKICDYICEDAGYEACYNECSGEALDMDCFEIC